MISPDRARPTLINVARMRPEEVMAVVVDPRGLSIDLAECIETLAGLLEDDPDVDEGVTVSQMMRVWDCPLSLQDRSRLEEIGVNLARIDEQRQADLGQPNTIFTFTL